MAIFITKPNAVYAEQYKGTRKSQMRIAQLPKFRFYEPTAEGIRFVAGVGDVNVKIGDYVVIEQNGNIFACKEKDFKKKYIKS